VEAALVVFAVGFCGLWWIGFGLAVINNYRGIADWWTRQPDSWRLGPRVDPRRAAVTRIKAFVILAFGVLCLGVAFAGAIKVLIAS
jgi:hypothetical protein